MWMAGNEAPQGIAMLENRAPIAFNQADNTPPSDRMEKIGSKKLGSHTFYGFKKDREEQ